MNLPAPPHLNLVTSTTHMMLLAMTALLSFPLVISVRLSRSRMTVTKNL